MKYNDREIKEIIQSLEPKIKKSLKETNKENQQDLEQQLRELIIKKLKNNNFKEVPGFFEILEKQESELQNKS